MNTTADVVDMTELVLIRGLPGQGKTTMAKEQFPYHVLCEADEYFTDRDGSYHFNPKRLGWAHKMCRLKCHDALRQHLNVVVANTFTTIEEIEPYIDTMPYDSVIILEPPGPLHDSVHGVPEDVIEKMRARYVPLEEVRKYFE